MFHQNFFFYLKGRCSAHIPHSFRLPTTLTFDTFYDSPIGQHHEGRKYLCANRQCSYCEQWHCSRKFFHLTESTHLHWDLRSISFPAGSASCSSALNSTLLITWRYQDGHHLTSYPQWIRPSYTAIPQIS